MRLVGYVREPADPTAGPPAFSQQEHIRRFADERGHLLVAVCQDLRRVGEPTGRDGYLGMLGVLESGAADTVVVQDVTTFSADAIVQEIVLWDLRRRGIRVLSTDEGDAAILERGTPPDGSRMLIRDVLERVEEHTTPIRTIPDPSIGLLPGGDVMVRLIESDAAEANA